MERRDLLKDQIEQFAKVIGKVVSDFMGLKNAPLSENIQKTDEQLKTAINLDSAEIISKSKNELKEIFVAQNRSDVHLELLSDYLAEIGLRSTPKDAEIYFIKASELLDIADEISMVFSFERAKKKTTIGKILMN